MNDATNASAGLRDELGRGSRLAELPVDDHADPSASAAASSKSCVTSSAGISSPASSSCSSARTVAFVWASSADERLVEQEHLRVARERARERDALALAAGELRRARVARGGRCRSARGTRRRPCLRAYSTFWRTVMCGKSA